MTVVVHESIRTVLLEVHVFEWSSLTYQYSQSEVVTNMNYKITFSNSSCKAIKFCLVQQDPAMVEEQMVSDVLFHFLK